MGSPEGDGYAEDGEGPQREVKLSPFSIAKYTVTNSQFAKFIAETGYLTTAEQEGWSHVFHMLLTVVQKRTMVKVPAETPWWYPTEHATWKTPEGPDSDWCGREGHPVVHVSWYDAMAYCNWADVSLPSEAQWEFAARAKSNLKFPWGSELMFEGRHMCNVWQGRFPGSNTADDGYVGTAPVNAFSPNAFGAYNMIGNVWEWCVDVFTTDYHTTSLSEDPINISETGSRSVRGGSFLCHESYCNRYRLGARNANPPCTTCSNVGFRVSS